MRKSATIVVLALAVAVLLYILFSGSCQKPTKDNSTEYAAVIEDRERLQRDSAIYAQKEKDLQAKIANQDSTINNIRAQHQQSNRQLADSKNTVLRLREDLRDYREKDTGYVNARIDSLLGEIDLLALLLGKYQALTDSLSISIDQQKENYESLASQRAQLISDLRASYNFVSSSYQQLYKDYSSVNKKFRRQKVITKIAAVLVVVESILIGLK